MPNEYDRIFKENMEDIFLPFIQKHFGINIISSEPLPGKLHKTLEREPDFIKSVTTDKQENFILHIEFQTANDPNMLYRMQTYHALLLEKYKLPLRQFCIYVGRPKPNMRTKLSPEEIMTGFELLDLHRLDAHTFLQSDIPEEIILAVLADFQGTDPVAFIRLILSRLKQLNPDEPVLRKVLEQLGVISRIQYLKNEYIQAIETSSMPITIDIEKDALFLKGRNMGRQEGRMEGRQEGRMEGRQEGRMEGRQEGRTEGFEKAADQFALRALQKGNMTHEEISELTGLSIERIKELQKTIDQE